MKIVVTVFGVLLMLAGGIFFLQGINIITVRSVMRGDIHWAIYGGTMVVIGLILIAATHWQRFRRKK